MQTLIPVDQAENIIRTHLTTAPVETVPLAEAKERFLRENILADRPLPPFNRVMMDGIAINHASFLAGNKTYPIAVTQAAGAPATELTNPDTCIEVMTGCILPRGCNSVIPVEEIDIIEGTAHLKKTATSKPNQFIHLTGSDTPANTPLLTNGQQLKTPELTIAASVGATTLQVSALPSILVISTGDELVAPETTPLPHQIRRSHATSLHATITGMKLGLVDTLHVPDSPDILRATLSNALTSHNILIITGGVSRGKYDHVAPVLHDLLGQPHFHGIAQRPGKPMAFWTSNTPPPVRANNGAAKDRETKARESGGLLDRSEATCPEGVSRLTEPANQYKRAIFALPGNPVSVMACAARYLFPAITETLSGTQPSPPSLPATGTFNCPPNFTGLTPCRVNNGHIQLIPPSNSGNFLALTGTHGIAELPGTLARKDLLNEPATFYPWT